MSDPRWRGLPARPRGLRRLVFRAPVVVFRARLGWVFAGRLVLLTHRGRRTGRWRRSVVEVVTRDRRTGAVVVASGFGAGADWFRNLRAEPRCTMQLGVRRVPVRAVALSADEGAEVMLAYARRHPASARVLAGYLGVPVDGGAEAYRALGRVLPYLRLEPLRGMTTAAAG